jgi:FkbM family methyltransferase
MHRAGRVLHNAFRSPGRRLFGSRFTRDYIRLAVGTAGDWGDTRPGTIDWLGGRLEYLNRSHAVFLLHEIFVNAEYAFESERPDPLIVDAGANIGVATFFFARLYPRARIVAFEPHPTTFACLARNLDANGLAGVRAEQAAVGGADGTADLFASPADPGSLTASMQPVAGAAAERVRVVRLSSHVNEPVDFLKLDVEGAEDAVLDDLLATGAMANVRRLVLETHDRTPDRPRAAAIDRRLRQAGFTTDVRPQRDDVTTLTRAFRQ